MPALTEEESAKEAKILRDARDQLVIIARKDLVKEISHKNVERLDARLTASLNARQKLRKSRYAFDLVELDKRFAEDLNTIVLPRLAECIRETIPVPGERADTGVSGATDGIVFPLLTVFRRIQTDALKLAGQKLGEAENQKLAGRLADLATYYRKYIKEQLETGEAPDIAAITIDQLRLDILRWILEELKVQSAIRAVKTHANATARSAIRSAEHIVNRYFDERGLDREFDFATVLANLEDIVSLINRIIEADEEDWREESGLATALGSEIVLSFLNSIGKTVLAIFQDLERRLADGTLTPEYMDAHMKKASSIYVFCRLVDERYSKQVLSAVNKIIINKSKKLSADLVALRNQGRDDRHINTYLAILKQFADSLTTASS